MRLYAFQHALAVLKKEPWQMEDPMFTEQEAIAELEREFGLQLGNDVQAWERIVNERMERWKREWLAADEE